MSYQELSARPARARKDVPTYNLKKLSRETRPGPLRKSQARPPILVGTNNSHASSGFTSPMASPSLPTEQVSPINAVELSEKENSLHESAAATTSSYSCFTSPGHSNSQHYCSAQELLRRKVWVGYLAPGKQKESLHGLPSFDQLRNNWKNKTPPFPPSLNGRPSGDRMAVCRGCIGTDSSLITVGQISFGPDRKLDIMPLQENDGDELFCILMPQDVQPSIPGLRGFRPYEFLHDPAGRTFSNEFMLLTSHIENQNGVNVGTLHMILAHLSAKELSRVERRNGKRPVLDSSNGPALVPSLQIAKRSLSFAATNSSKNAKAGKQNGQGTGRVKRQRTQRSHSQSTHEALDQESFDDDDDEEGVSHSREPSTATVPRIQDPTPISPSLSDHPPPHQTPLQAPVHYISQTSSQSIVQTPNRSIAQTPNQPIAQTPQPPLLDLTDDQAKRTFIVWKVNDNGFSYEFLHSIYECKTITGLFSLLQEETEYIPAVATVLAETKMWLLVYTRSDGAKKAFVARKDTEVVFDRLQAALAQSQTWRDNPSAKLDIELEPLSKPGPVTAT